MPHTLSLLSIAYLIVEKNAINLADILTWQGIPLTF